MYMAAFAPQCTLVVLLMLRRHILMFIEGKLTNADATELGGGLRK